MKTTEINRINMGTTVSGVITKYQSIWKDHVAFSEAVDELEENQVQIDEQIQIVEGNSGAASAKTLARTALGNAANEIIGAVYSYASKIGDPELQAKVNYSPSSVTAGKASAVVGRCRAIHATATEVGEPLVKHGITAAKLAAFAKKIDTFDKVKTAPRESRVERRAAAQVLTQLVRANAKVLDEQLDNLMIQFKDSAPSFYNEYSAARVLVDQSGSHVNGNETPVTPTPAPTPAPTA